MTYDSLADTWAHVHEVRFRLLSIIAILEKRGEAHDASKMEPPEKEAYDEVTPKLNGLTYGSNEYKRSLAEMGEALRHHYDVNEHHPEHFPSGVDDMSLIDIVEMLADWAAAATRHADGDLMRSIRINQERFGMSEQLTRILENTAIAMRWV